MIRYLAILIALCTQPVMAQPELNTHGMETQGQSFRVTGKDPYIVLRADHPAIQLDKQTNELLLGLAISEIQHSDNVDLDDSSFDDSDRQDQLHGELFYSTDPADTFSLDQGFHPYQRIRFKLPARDSQGLRIQLPDDAISSSFFRLDLDDCAQCLLSLQSPIEGNLVEATAYRVYAGLRNLPAGGLELSPQEWALNDLAFSSSSNPAMLTRSGGDPYLISPALDIFSTQVAGVYFEFKIDSTNLSPQDFQLFYATEQHQFIETASSIVRISPAGGAMKFFIPLDFLSTEFPASTVLERLRLDLATHGVRSNEPSNSPNLTFKRSMLIHISDLEAYETYTPSALVHFNRQKQNKRQVFAGIMSKLGRDLPFLILYPLLVLMILLALIIKFRKAS